MESVAMDSMRCFTALIIMLTLSQVRPECTDSRSLTSACGSLSKRDYLLFESTSQRINCPCSSPNAWTLSADGLTGSALELNISSEKYTVVNVNSLDITLNNITGADGGLYSCRCDQMTTALLCIMVYERAVYASCPHEYTIGCTEETQLSVTAGESAKFNATVVYTRGGSCPEFQQDVQQIRLLKINEGFRASNVQLYSCLTSNAAVCPISDGRVSLDRGNILGLEFIFTLSNTIHMNDSGQYEVEIDIEHPRTMSLNTLTKKFQLQVNPGPTSPTTTDQPSPDSTDTTSTTTSTGSNVAQMVSASGGEIAAAVLVPVIVIILILFGVVFLVVKWKLITQTFLHQQPLKVENQHLQTDNPEIGSGVAANVMNRINNTEVVINRRNNRQIETDTVIVKEEVFLPPENPRDSFIESAMHELPSTIEIKLNKTNGEKHLDIYYKREHSIQSQDVHV